MSRFKLLESTYLSYSVCKSYKFSTTWHELTVYRRRKKLYCGESGGNVLGSPHITNTRCSKNKKEPKGNDI